MRRRIVNSYTRSDVLRILRVTNRQLLGWEKAGLFPVTPAYTFFDLLQLKKLRDLRAKRVRSAVILESLQKMQQQVAGMENPLLEASVFSTGSRVAFRHRGAAVEPIAGQFVMDFAGREVVAANVRSMPQAETAAELFAKAVAMEEDPASQQQAMDLYKRVVELDPLHAAAYINLGTLCYNRQNFREAETYYRKAVEVDPRYALAYFDLGNVLDETGRMPEAIQAYKNAILIAPTYADAHYNLALAYEKIREPRKALRHWQAYARLDHVGPWAVHARGQIRKIVAGEQLQVLRRRS